MVGHFCNLSTWGVVQEDQKVEAIYPHIASKFANSLDTRNSVSKSKQNKISKLNQFLEHLELENI